MSFYKNGKAASFFVLSTEGQNNAKRAISLVFLFLRSQENSGMMGGRHHFIPKKLWRKYNAVSMNGDSPNESNGDDRCVRSPAENSGMRPYDLNTGGVRIVTFPSIIQDRFV